MSIPQIGDINESKPAGSDNINAGDNAIREHKTQVRQIMEVDHEYPATGKSATAGQHKQVTLQEQADIGSGATGVPILGAQTISGAPELVYTNEADTDIQITNTTGINAPSLTGTLPDAIIDAIYPIGSVLTFGVSTNPSTLIGGTGTWTAIAGKVIVGIAGSGTFNTLNTTGGAETHILTTSEVPNLALSIAMRNANGWDGSNNNVQASSASGDSGNYTGSTTDGGGGAHNNLQPYIVKYVWERTS